MSNLKFWNRGSAWWLFAVSVGLFTSVALIVGDVILGPPTGHWRVILWPAELLLWASGSGTPLVNGRFEWTAVQDFAMWLGDGLAAAFWIIVARLGWRALSSSNPSTRGSA